MGDFGESFGLLLLIVLVDWLVGVFVSFSGNTPPPSLERDGGGGRVNYNLYTRTIVSIFSLFHFRGGGGVMTTTTIMVMNFLRKFRGGGVIEREEVVVEIFLYI